MSDESFRGVPVNCCFPGSLASRAGVKAGDVVLAANGVRVDSLDAYMDARSVYTDRVELTVQRGNEILEFVLRFDEQQAAAVIDTVADATPDPALN